MANMVRWGLIGAVAVGVGVVAWQWPLFAARRTVASSMKDPSSAQFRGVKRGDRGHVCGEVNGKNEYGAYVGFVGFMLSDSTGLTIHSEDTPINSARWQLYCEPSSVRSKADRDTLISQMRQLDSQYERLDQLQKQIEALKR